MEKLIFIHIITASVFFSACSGSSGLLNDTNRGQEPNNTDNQLKHPQNDSLKLPKPADIPFEEENHDIKWI